MSDTAERIAADPAAAAAAMAWAAGVAPRLRADPAGWTTPSIVDAKPKRLGAATILPDQSARFEPGKDLKPGGADDGIIVTTATVPGPAARVRLEVLPDDSYGGRVTCNGDDSFTLTAELAVLRAGKDKPEPLNVSDGYPGQQTWSYSNGRLQTSVPGPWTSPPALAHAPQSMDYVIATATNFREGDRLVATITSENVGRVRLSETPVGLRTPGAAPLPEVAAALAAASPTPRQREVIAGEYFAGAVGGLTYEFGEVLDWVRQIAECRDGRAFTTVTVATTPRVTRVLPRGNWQDESGEIVAPSPPGFLSAGKGAPAADAPRQTRLDLANWIVSRDNPLTARAFVNRLWKQFFGTGLSAVVNDLGTQGEYPSHPELLDWLAVEFMDRGWDVKAMVRMIVTSATYKQSSTYRPELAEADPNNRLLARQSPRRLEAEFVRDNALAAAGLIRP